MDCVNGKLALIVVREDGAYLETINLGDLDMVTSNSPILLDRKVTNTTVGVNASFGAGETTWTLPFDQTGLKVINATTGAEIPSVQVGTNGVRTTGTAGDLTALSVVIGVPYTFSYTPTRIYPRSVRGGDESADTTSRLRLGYLTIFSRQSTGYEVTVTPLGRTPYVYTNTGGLDVFRVPVMTRNDEATIVISHAGHLNCSITGFEWEGTVSSRSRRI
jgi:hypothetical protein